MTKEDYQILEEATERMKKYVTGFEEFGFGEEKEDGEERSDN